MHHIQIDDNTFEEAKHRAEGAGFSTVDEFIVDLLQTGDCEPHDDFDVRFTPEVNACLDRVVADMDAGNKFSLEEVRNHLDHVRTSWRKNRAS